MQFALRFEHGIQCVNGIVKRDGERIPDNSKAVAVVRLNRLIQDLMMPRQQARHVAGIFLREFGAAFDVSEEEGDRAGRRFGHMFGRRGFHFFEIFPKVGQIFRVREDNTFAWKRNPLLHKRSVLRILRS